MKKTRYSVGTHWGRWWWWWACCQWTWSCSRWSPGAGSPSCTDRDPWQSGGRLPLTWLRRLSSRLNSSGTSGCHMITAALGSHMRRLLLSIRLIWDSLCVTALCSNNSSFSYLTCCSLIKLDFYWAKIKINRSHNFRFASFFFFYQSVRPWQKGRLFFLMSHNFPFSFNFHRERLKMKKVAGLMKTFQVK